MGESMKYQNKFNLTYEQSMFLAKKKWDENVYCGMKMENRSVTFPQTQTILNGVNVPNVDLYDIQAILNMRDAWKYLFKTMKEPVTLEYFCKINEYISRNESLEWGVLRKGVVGISGTEYLPPIPNREDAAAQLSAHLHAEGLSVTEIALNIFCWGARGQFFWDGNKRTSMTLANKIMVSHGVGILTITDKHMEEFNVLLLDFYNTNENQKLKDFLYAYAIQGMTV